MSTEILKGNEANGFEVAGVMFAAALAVIVAWAVVGSTVHLLMEVM